MGFGRPSVTGGGAGTITAVTAGTALGGGGSSGGVTVNLDISELSDGVVATADKFLLLDSDGSTQILESVDDTAAKLPGLTAEAAVTVANDYVLFLDGGATGDCKKESIADLATAMAGSGLSASSGQLTADTAGTVTSITPDADSGSGSAITSSGTLTFTGGTNVTTSVSGTTVTVNASGGSTDLGALTEAAVDVAADSFGFVDANDSNNSKRDTIADLATAMAGTGLAASSGQLTVSGSATATAMVSSDSLTAVDAAQQIIAIQVFT